MSPKAEPVHVRTLDGVRFFAFFAVFVFHALQNNAHVGKLAHYGSLGVQVFFVLSGFLIGGILLNLKQEPAAPLGHRLKIFYARRALRIFPLYYMTLAVLLLIEHAGVEAVGGSQTLLWNLLYLTNIKIFLSGMIGGLSHLWSLAVEEHFYFVAPFVILLCSVRTLSWICIATWVLGAAGRVAMQSLGYSMAPVLSPLQFDCMTVGVAAAILQAQGSFLGLSKAAASKLTKLAALVCLPLLALWQVQNPVAGLIGQVFDHFVVSVAVSGLVLFLWNAPAGSSRWADLFGFGPLPYLGKISYALYVFHLPCLVFSSAWFSFMPHGSALPALVMTIVAAIISWHVFEGPINGLKRFFPYAKPAQASYAPAAAETAT